MTTTITSPTTPDTTAPTSARRVAVRASLIAVAADIAWMAVIGTVVPPLAVFAALTLATIVAGRRWTRASTIGLGLLALAAIGGGLPFLLADLASPSDPLAFLWAVLSGGGRAVAIVATILALTGRDRAARRLVTGSVVVLGLAVLGSLGARIAVSSDVGQPDDVEVVTADMAFPEHVTVPSGGAVLLDNRDPVRHTFTVADTDVDVLLEPGVQRRVPIGLAPGTYDLICVVPGHESMTGTLEVN